MLIKFCSAAYYFSLGGLVVITLRPEKLHRPHAGLNSRILGLETSTLSRDSQGLPNQGWI
jgi:hypothetical protein